MATNVSFNHDRARPGQHVRLRLEKRAGTLPARATIEVRTNGLWSSLDGEQLPPLAPAPIQAAVRLVPAPRGWWEREARYQSSSPEPIAAPEVISSPQRDSFLFERWPRMAARHPWRVLIGTLILMVVLGALFARFGGQFTDSFTLPGTESQRLIDLLDERFPSTAGDTATIVIRAPEGVDDPEIRMQIDSLVAEVNALPDVLGAISPYEQPGAISADGTIARMTVQYEKRTEDMEKTSLDALLDLRRERSTPDLQVEAGGSVARAGERGGLGQTELIGIGAAVVILMIAFGSVVAMGLPILVALLALVAGFLLVGIGASYLNIPSMTTQFAAMIGIGVGIDYALLIITRFREGLARGLGTEDAIVRAEATAGRSVVFAGFTVVIALLGLWAAGIPFVAYMGSAGAVVVALSVIVAIFVLPAVLGLVGTRIDKWRIPFLAASAHESETGFAYRLSRAIQRTPLAFFVLSLGILLLLAAPVLAMRLGSSDSGSRPTSSTTRRAYDLLSEGFGPGFNGPVLIGFGLDEPGAAAAVEDLLPVIGMEDGVASVSGPSFNESGSAATILVVPETAPQAEETNDLVHRLRRIVPAAVDGMGIEVAVGGTTAVFIDVGDKIRTRMPLFFAAVIGLSFILLMAVFRSVLIPIKAAIMNLLSVGAAYGVLVAVFQWGWFGGILGVDGTGPIESFLPMMMFAVLFGLSMDYEVFLVSRIQEEYLESGDNSESVARGLSATTRVISAAAAIMIAGFLSFAFS
ncbi:MAG: MMPL family transporter, partial [Chloroflexi bacterium]|nr:MMPL family transporter [Chloroflexota bacterium]